jgi:hypothetical protein
MSKREYGINNLEAVFAKDILAVLMDEKTVS